MKKLATILALALVSTAGFAATAKKVQCYETDTSRPGLKQPGECDLDQLTYGAHMGSIPSAQVATVTKVERGYGFIHQTVYTLTAASATITDATTAGAHGGIQLYDFPNAVITILGASTDLAITAGAGGTADGAAVLCSMGSIVTATNNATLTSTEADFIPSTAATLTAGVGVCDGESVTAGLIQFNSTSTTTDLFLNFAVPDADQTDASNDTIAVTGTVTVTWIESGDN